MSRAEREVWDDVEWLDEGDEFDPYPSLREALSAEYTDLPDEDIEALVQSLYPDVSAEDLEGFFNSLKKAVHSVGKVAKRALPGVVQGATTGAAAGPWGALVGSIAGGALRAATGGRGGGGGRVTRSTSAGGGQAARLLGRGALRQLSDSPAAAQLLKILGQPQVTQALMSMAMGGAGKGTVRVGNVPVPTGAITNALRRLLERAESEFHGQKAGESAGTPLYLLDDTGEFVVDPTDDDARADLVIELLELADAADALGSGEFEDEEIAEVDGEGWEDDYTEFDDDLSPDDEAELLYQGVDFDALELELEAEVL